MYNEDMSANVVFMAITGQEILDRFTHWNVILGLVLLIAALVAVFASTPIFMKTKLADEKKGKAIIVTKIVGMALAVLGALLACLF